MRAPPTLRIRRRVRRASVAILFLALATWLGLVLALFGLIFYS